MAIEWTSHALTVTDVKSVVVTVIGQEQSGDYVRELRIFGGDGAPEPPIQDIDAPPPDQGRLLVTVRLKTTSRDRISISVPSLSF